MVMKLSPTRRDLDARPSRSPCALHQPGVAIFAATFKGAPWFFSSTRGSLGLSRVIFGYIQTDSFRGNPHGKWRMTGGASMTKRKPPPEVDIWSPWRGCVTSMEFPNFSCRASHVLFRASNGVSWRNQDFDLWCFVCLMMTVWWLDLQMSIDRILLI